MNARKQSKAAAWIGLLLLAFTRGAQEKPARVPCAKIEAWVNQSTPRATSALTKPATKPATKTAPATKTTQPVRPAPEKAEVPDTRTVTRRPPPQS